MSILTTGELFRENRKRVLHVALLGAWALIQYSLGNKIYCLFIIIFFLILALPRRQNLMLLTIPVLVIVLFNTPILDTGTELKQWNLNTVQNYKRTLINIFTPNSGQEVLPGQVRQMLSLLKSNHVISYRLSRQLHRDPLIMQRIVESAWPIKMDPASPYLLNLPDEPNNDPACTVIDHRKDVVLANCY